MHIEDIKAGLRKRGWSQARIARELGVLPSAICHVLYGKRSQRIEAAISKILSAKPEALWPERYGKNTKTKAA